MSSKVMY